jgi:hypothetical protein
MRRSGVAPPPKRAFQVRRSARSAGSAARATSSPARWALSATLFASTGIARAPSIAPSASKNSAAFTGESLQPRPPLEANGWVGAAARGAIPSRCRRRSQLGVTALGCKAVATETSSPRKPASRKTSAKVFVRLHGSKGPCRFVSSHSVASSPRRALRRRASAAVPSRVGP